MTNEEAKKMLEAFKNYLTVGNPIWHKDEVAEVFELAISALSRDRWISVEERLPEPHFAREWYLVSLKSGCVKTLAYEAKPRIENGLFQEGWHDTASPVTHWRPLPEPPKEDKQE